MSESRDGGVGAAVATTHVPARLVAGAVGLVWLSGPAAAHGTTAAGGDPVTLSVVLGLPTLAGLGGGAIALQRLRTDRPGRPRTLVGLVLGLALAALGLTAAASALWTDPWLGLAGGVVGVLALPLATGADRATFRGCHADVAVGAVSLHRLLEGVAIGGLYAAGAAVGLLGALLVAGHTALESAVAGGVYAGTAPRRRAFGAIVVVQAGYVGGTLAGIGAAGAVPGSVRTATIALVGGVLLAVGTVATVRSVAVR